MVADVRNRRIWLGNLGIGFQDLGSNHAGIKRPLHYVCYRISVAEPRPMDWYHRSWVFVLEFCSFTFRFPNLQNIWNILIYSTATLFLGCGSGATR